MGPPDWDYNGNKSLGFPFNRARVSTVIKRMKSMFICTEGRIFTLHFANYVFFSTCTSFNLKHFRKLFWFLINLPAIVPKIVFLPRLKEASPPLRDSIFTSIQGLWRQLSVAAFPHNTLSLGTNIRNRELIKDPPLTQVGLFTVTLDPRPSWPQLLLPNMKSFPFSGETKSEAPESWAETHCISRGLGIIFSLI